MQVGHPEQLPSERFIINLTEAEFKRQKAEVWGMKSLRLGQTAYQTGDFTIIVPQFRPMFGVPQED